MRPEGSPQGALFSRDARRILSWSYSNAGLAENSNSTIQLWDVTTTEPIGPPIRLGEVAGAIYTQDERRVLSWSLDGTLRLWDVWWRGEDLFQVACAFAPMMSSEGEVARLSKRYAVEIGEPICQKDDHIPEPDWINMMH